MPYSILEIEQPGMRLEHLENEPEINSELYSILTKLIHSFLEANIALNYFNDGESESMNNFSYESLSKKSELTMEALKEFDANNLITDFHERYYEQDRFIKRYLWNNGLLPSGYNSAKSFFNAKIFLFALDNISKLLGVLNNSRYKCPFDIKGILSRMNKIYPDLRNVRNSAHHQEDVIRGYGKTKKGLEKFTLEPMNTPLFQGNIESHGMIANGRKFGMTLGNGKYGEIDISIETLSEVRDIIQEVLYSFRWSGMRIHLPV